MLGATNGPVPFVLTLKGTKSSMPLLAGVALRLSLKNTGSQTERASTVTPTL